MFDEVITALKEATAKNVGYQEFIDELADKKAEYFMHLLNQAKLSAHRRNMELAEHNARTNELLKSNMVVQDTRIGLSDLSANESWMNYLLWNNELETIRWCIETEGSQELSIHKTADNYVDYIELYTDGKQVAHIDIPYKKEVR